MTTHPTAGEIEALVARKWLTEASQYFANRPYDGEDRAFWANVANSETCQRISNLLDTLASRLAAAEGANQWLPIETAPHGQKIIAGYFNELGKHRTIMAIYFEANTLPAGDDSDDDEWAPEGWYEDNETRDEIMLCTTPTHWRPLPTPSPHAR